MTIRVQYVFEVKPHELERFKGAWESVVLAHVASGRGALESMLLRDPEREDRVVIISRWRSEQAWSSTPTSLIHPIGLIEMRRWGKLIGEPKVFEELGHLLK